MGDGPYLVLTMLGVLGTGVVAGVFCAFSTFVMRGLAALPPARGVAAVQAINVAAVRPPFMLVFLGSTVLCAVLTAVTCVVWPDEGAIPSLVGGALYLCGSFGLTVVAHIPRNDRLARLEADSAEAAAYWPVYVRGWTRWNHVRALASAGAALAYLLALTG
ncbi:anthrone oxygenase family protein [Streptomyces sp. NPDC005908]|uniref:anthrone oxygenase family protein n=1 Tax=unclassified Streptomyces TaxID=2593676 RepID=UPI0011A9E470|nr:anthrone oxygenase family protein [Streptomyces sp. T12]TWD27029.1 putative membrane protein [Streptomyces sp. T12]